MKTISGSGRTRCFACVVYPDSAPKDWLNKLKRECVPAFVSPLHDKDINPDKTQKKSHYHVLVMFESVKTQKQWEEFRNEFGGVGTEVVQSTRGYARYLCHLDNPEKARYDPDKVICIGGADYNYTCSRDSDKYGTIRQMLSFVQQNHITSYVDLMDHALAFEPEWYRSLCDNSSFVVSTYINELRKDMFRR